MKQILLFILALLGAVVQGARGETLQWTSGNTTCTLTDDGTFTVSPMPGTNGAMANYSASEIAPWHSKIHSVKQLVFEPGVTEIGGYAFANLDDLEVNLPKGMKKIHAYAFQYADITKVTIPTTMTNVAKGAFFCCDNLEDVYCHAEAEDLTWKGTLWDFIHHPENYIYVTKMHVHASQLQAYQSKFGEKLNVSIVGDIVPMGNWTDAENRSTKFREGNNKFIYIDNEADLALLAYNLNTGVTEYIGYTFLLTRDLDMSAHYWTPIGTKNHSFSSIFDGQGHVISGVIVNRPNDDYNGLFGYGRDCVIKNLALKNSSITGRDFTGGVVGSIFSGNSNCILSNVVCYASVSGANNVGGVVGGVSCSRDDFLHVLNFLYLGNSITATGQNKGAIIGRFSGYYYLENNYYTNEAVSGLSSSDVRAYEMRPSSLPRGVKVSYSGYQGIEYNGSFYAPNETSFTINVSAVDPLVQIIDRVCVDGKEITASSNGAYPYILEDAENHTLTVTTTNTDITGNGTKANPYLITTAKEWDVFANTVNNGTTFNGKFVKLGADITVSTMVGSSGLSFDGTFDGDNHTLTVNYGTEAEPFGQEYCAPFRYVYGATIKNLHVDGNIYTANQYAAGFVGRSGNTILIEGCHSSVVIHSTVNGQGGHGGFVANTEGATIRNSWFDGSFLGEKTNGCGGFVGWSTYRISFENCLFNPAAVTISNEGCRTFARYDNAVVPYIDSSCYFVTPMGTGQGRRAYTEEPGDNDHAIVTAADGNTYYTYSPLFWDQEEYRDLTWGADYSAMEFTISTAEQLAQFAYLVNAGKDFKGKTITLTDNIDLGAHYWKAIGVNSDNKRWFRGSFDGAGYVIDNVYAIEDPNDPNTQAIGLFGCIENANLHDVVLTNIIAVNGLRSDVGGLVAKAYADFGYHDVYAIKNCHVLSGSISLAVVKGGSYESTGAIAAYSDVDIEACSTGANLKVTSVDRAGGIVGYRANQKELLGINIKGCISAASVSAENIAGGVVGYRENYMVKDCLYIGSSVSGKINRGAIVGRVASYGEFSNNYFTDSRFNGNGCTLTNGVSLGYTYTVEPEGLGEKTAAYDSGITAYEHGLEFESQYVMATPPTVVTLIDTEDNSTVINENAGKQVNAILAGRTLYKDGSWNTLSLPFDVEDFTGTPLEGAKVMTLQGTTYSEGTLTIDFVETTSIEAGYPYIIKWTKADDYVNDNQHNLCEPLFENVIISNTSPDACTTGTDEITFKGLYAPLSIGEDGDKTLLFLGDDNALHYSMKAMDINAFHAYFTATANYGDVNGDGMVNVTDVTLLVNYILGMDSEGLVFSNADVNGDDIINVADITSLVNFILNGSYILNVVVTGADDITFGDV